MKQEPIKQHTKKPVFTCSLDDIKASFERCPVSVVQSRLPVSIFPDEHCHESYEFVIPFTSIPHASLGKKKLSYFPRHIFPVNSGHEHGIVKPMTGISFDCIMVDRSFVDEITYSMAGKTGISFTECFPPDQKLTYLIDSFVEEERGRQKGYQLVMQNLATQILVHLIRHSRSNISFPRHKKPVLGKNRFAMVCELMKEKYNSNISLAELSREADLSPYHFIRAFKAQTGKTPYEYLLDIKIEKARDLMCQDLTITEICYLCGFNNPSHFSTVFKKRVGVSPSGYRNWLQGK